MGLTSTKNQFLVSISGIHGNWDTKTGGNGSGSPVKFRPGGSLKEEIIGTPPTFEDIVVTRGYDPDLTKFYQVMTRNINKTRHTITYQPTDASLVKKGRAIVYPNCLLVGVTLPDVDSNATGDRATVTMTFSTAGPV